MKATPIVMLAFLAAPALAAEPQDLTAKELAAILGIEHWRIPIAAQGFQWTIDVVSASALPKEPKHLSEQGGGAFEAMISLRPLRDGEYEYRLDQGSDSGTGSLVPCKEPEGSKSICSSYSMSFERDPICLPGCKAFVIATLESEGRGAQKKQIVISQTERLIITPGNGTIVIPIK